MRYAHLFQTGFRFFMALLNRPLYGDEATGTLARALSFRRTNNPPDLPGEPSIYFGTVTKIPVCSCPPSPAQSNQRFLYSMAVGAWNALSNNDRAFYNSFKPSNLTGFNFFIRLFLIPAYAYFGFRVFFLAFFQLAPGPDQPVSIDYNSYFPVGMDEVPLLLDGAHSPQAWLFNSLHDRLISIQSYVILHKSGIER